MILGYLKRCFLALWFGEEFPPKMATGGIVAKTILLTFHSPPPLMIPITRGELGNHVEYIWPIQKDKPVPLTGRQEGRERT